MTLKTCILPTYREWQSYPQTVYRTSINLYVYVLTKHGMYVLFFNDIRQAFADGLFTDVTII